MTNNQPTYRSYLLRLWQTANCKDVKASLFNVQNPAERQHFATIDDLYVFLHTTFTFPGAEQNETSAPPVHNPREASHATLNELSIIYTDALQ